MNSIINEREKMRKMLLNINNDEELAERVLSLMGLSKPADPIFKRKEKGKRRKTLTTLWGELIK